MNVSRLGRPLVGFLVGVLVPVTVSSAHAAAPVTLPVSFNEVNSTMCSFRVQFHAEDTMRIYDDRRTDFTWFLHQEISYTNLNTRASISSNEVIYQQMCCF